MKIDKEKFLGFVLFNHHRLIKNMIKTSNMTVDYKIELWRKYRKQYGPPIQYYDAFVASDLSDILNNEIL